MGYDDNVFANIGDCQDFALTTGKCQDKGRKQGIKRIAATASLNEKANIICLI